jgi:hypothetical protein
MYVHLNVEDIRQVLEASQSAASKGLFEQAYGLLNKTLVDELAARREKRSQSATEQTSQPLEPESGLLPVS